MNLKQKLFWNILTGISALIILYMLYSTYTLNEQFSKFETKLAREEAGSDTELRDMIEELEVNYSSRTNTKFKMNMDPTNLGRALNIEGLEDYYMSGSGKIHVDFIWTNKKNITKAAIQYKRKMHFLTEGDTLAGGKIIELSPTKLIFEKDGESSEYVVVSR
ncbi:MAG: hypothetical protein H8E72_05200 [Candidatus Marinimicrobia bacterium]|nr:hypothetical protein [Candidatus Neomarinimicrobiota bacterium]